MAEETIKITVGADTSQLNAELTKAQNNLKLFQQALAKSTNIDEIKYLQRNIGALEKEIGSLSSNLTGKLVSSSGQATNTLTNLNRVVQDAPYGFIGIANNINPLIESFGRLRAETGSIGGAFKSLGSSLAGPAGIGIAVAAITTAITFAQIGFERWGAAAKKVKEASDGIKNSQNDFSKSLDSARSSALATSISLQNYVDIAKNGQLPLEQRNEALKKANEILGEHGTKLTLASVATAEGTKNIELYTKALIAQAVAEKYVDQIAQAKIDQIKLTKELSKAEQEAKRLKIESNKASEIAAGFAEAGGFAIETETAANLKYKDAVANVTSIKLKLSAATNILTNSTNEAKKATEEATAAFAALGTKTKESTDDAKKTAETYKDVIKNLNESVKDQINIQIGLTGVVGEDPSTLKERINLYLTAIKKLISDFNIDPKSEIIVNLTSELNELQFVQKAQDNFKKAESAVKAFKPTINVPILPVVDINKPIPLKGFQLDQSQLDTLTQLLTSTANDIAITFGQTLGAALSGQASIGDFFTGMFEQIGKGMQQFGKYMIQFAIKVEAIKKFALANPALAIAGGIALIALGALLASQTSKKQAFAVGTNFAPGGLALVGERGPEMVSLPRGAKVTPAAQTAQMMGGAMQQVEVFGVLRGQDIYFSNKKYSQTYRRTT